MVQQIVLVVALLVVLVLTFYVIRKQRTTHSLYSRNTDTALEGQRQALELMRQTLDGQQRIIALLEEIAGQRRG